MIINAKQNNNIIRALCDNGSQANLITEQAVIRMGVKVRKAKSTFIGINGAALGGSVGTVILKIQLIPTNQPIKALFYVVKTITHYTPSPNIRTYTTCFDHLELADTYYKGQQTIEALLGAKIWLQIIEPGVKRSPDNLAAAQKTKLGWVIFRTEKDPSLPESPYIGNVIPQRSTDELIQQIERFWEIEDIPTSPDMEDNICEKIFREQHTRDSDGRYIVKIPFNEKLSQLGKSKSSALRQFFSMEKRMIRDEVLARNYREFMAEYESLGHMGQIHEDTESGYYTPHHGVMSSNKFRIVFNASCKTSSGLSLNETELVGPKLQRDLSLILINFRRFRYGITGDVVKMYRQVAINEEHRKFQKIIWRPTQNEPIRIYQLNTVTYGHAAAPHCAIRAMIQCANDHENEHPLAAKMVRECFYVDDLIGGADTIEEINYQKEELGKLLKKGAFEMAKWKGNGDAVEEMQIGETNVKTVLGLFWNIERDHFSFKSLPDEPNEEWTKRKILSKIGRLYDPNGFIAPIIVSGKMIIQLIWKDNCDWDEPVNEPLKSEWSRFNAELTKVESIKVPRWFGLQSNQAFEVHGFCDASERAYGAVIYIRFENDNKYMRQIVASKTRVAPLKVLSIPRLELCAAKLLIDLEEALLPTLGPNIQQIFNWSDSQIVLHWLNKSSTDLKVFVANRVSHVQRKSDKWNVLWNWVSGKENPADLASRGSLVTDLATSSLWWEGPSWLQFHQKYWPINEEELEDETIIEAVKEAKLFHHVNIVKPTPSLERGPWYQHKNPGKPTDFLETYNSFHKMKRVMATVLRAIRNFKNYAARCIEPITPNEIEAAGIWLIRQDQKTTFYDEYKTLEPKRGGPHANLTFERDENLKILRILGRVVSSNLTMDEQKPIALSHTGRLAKPLIYDAHNATLHGGTQLMLQYLRSRFWLTGARKLIKQFILKCPSCFRYRMKTSTQLMASLPTIRTNPSMIFDRVGVDYAGPINVRSRLGRNPIITKAYISVFVCLITRAVHLELVSDATTAAFIAALRRFTSRKGNPSLILSDNGSNFIGANNYIKTVLKSNNDHAAEYMKEFNIDWKFITPLAPHHGGIYEAAVKSTKHHLLRVIGEETWSFEELSTLLTQIEACLNSRPLSAISDDPTDLVALTPAHFLIGRPLVAVPDSGNLTNEKDNRLNRWEKVQKMTQIFWQRWKDEYLMTLINRSKWHKKFRNIQVNDLVVVRDDNSPPTRWKMARVIETFPGKDNIVRSVKIQSANGVYNRPITKLAVLISAEEQKDPEYQEDAELFNST